MQMVLGNFTLVPGWSGGAIVLGKLPVPGRPTIWMTVGQGPTALAGCAVGLFGHFHSHLSFLSLFSLSLGDGPIYTELLSQRAVKIQNNQPTNNSCAPPENSQCFEI